MNFGCLEANHIDVKIIISSQMKHKKLWHYNAILLALACEVSITRPALHMLNYKLIQKFDKAEGRG